MKIYTKKSVDILGVQSETVLAIMLCSTVFEDAGQKFTLTSVTDGNHSRDSFHYCGRAFDIRTRDLRGIIPHTMASRLQEALGPQFDVVLESDHIHVEHDPK